MFLKTWITWTQNRKTQSLYFPSSVNYSQELNPTIRDQIKEFWSSDCDPLSLNMRKTCLGPKAWPCGTSLGSAGSSGDEAWSSSANDDSPAVIDTTREGDRRKQLRVWVNAMETSERAPVRSGWFYFGTHGQIWWHDQQLTTPLLPPGRIPITGESALDL